MTPIIHIDGPRRRRWLALLAAGLVACGSPATEDPAPSMNDIAERYVKLVLALGAHDADYVDAYYGPESWQEEIQASAWTLDDIGREAAGLATALADVVPGADDDELVSLRTAYLRRQLEAVAARVRMLAGTTLSFDEESRALYDAVAPTNDAAAFEAALAALADHLPGDGPLIDRYDAFRRDFVIAPDRLDTVFGLAIAECRARTGQHLELPTDERFTVEFVTDKSWSGYNWYQGGYRSLIQVNTDLPIYIDRAIDLACHEGYPGHHVYNVLLEQHLVRGRDWPEFTVYALFSPQSLIAEGTANYGIDVAFPGDERLAFEREVLYPAAGLDPTRAGDYAEVATLVARLEYAGNEAARGYLDGLLDRDAAVAWLTRYAMMPPDRAAQRTRFFDQYRSYVINYNLGRDLVAAFVDARAEGDSERRWAEFGRLLASPRLPSGLRADTAR